MLKFWALVRWMYRARMVGLLESDGGFASLSSSRFEAGSLNFLLHYEGLSFHLYWTCQGWCPLRHEYGGLRDWLGRPSNLYQFECLVVSVREGFRVYINARLGLVA